MARLFCSFDSLTYDHKKNLKILPKRAKNDIFSPIGDLKRAKQKGLEGVKLGYP